MGGVYPWLLRFFLFLHASNISVILVKACLEREGRSRLSQSWFYEPYDTYQNLIEYHNDMRWSFSEIRTAKQIVRFLYNIGFSVIGDRVSDGATKTLALNIERKQYY